MWDDFCAKVKKCNFGQKTVGYSPRFWVKTQDLGKKIIILQNFTSDKTCFFKGFPIDRTRKFCIVFFFNEFSSLGLGMGIASVACMSMFALLAWAC